MIPQQIKDEAERMFPYGELHPEEWVNLLRNAYTSGATRNAWVPISELEGQPKEKDFLILFETGEVRRYFEDNLPFSVITHFQPLPLPPTE